MSSTNTAPQGNTAPGENPSPQTNSASPQNTASAPAGDDRVGRRSPFALFFSMPAVGAFVGALVLAGLFFASADAFRNVGNIGTILYAAATVGVMAIFVALLMMGGEFDLSTGVAVTFSGLAAAHMAWYFGLNVWVGVGLALVMSLAVGAFNGFLLIKTGLPSFLVTLSTYFILWGVNLAVTRIVTGGVSSNNISNMDGWDSARAFFASSFTFGPITLNIIVIYWFILTAVLSWLLLRTRIGNWILASGGDPKAARAVGVPVTATKIGLFMGTGFAAWMIGMHTLFQYNNVQSGAGIGQEFVYIIAAVIGGCLLTGGYGSIVGAAVGALIYGMAVLGISYAGWDVDWLRTFLGAMLLGAVLVNMFVKRKAESL